MVIPKAGLATINKKNTSKAAKEIIKREANCFSVSSPLHRHGDYILLLPEIGRSVFNQRRIQMPKPETTAGRNVSKNVQ